MSCFKEKNAMVGDITARSTSQPNLEKNKKKGKEREKQQLHKAKPYNSP